VLTCTAPAASTSVRVHEQRDRAHSVAGAARRHRLEHRDEAALDIETDERHCARHLGAREQVLDPQELLGRDRPRLQQGRVLGRQAAHVDGWH
jgi:hypothetical protein